MEKVMIYCDGSTWPKNPGYGGWGALLMFNGTQKGFSGALGEGITNNVAELQAAIHGLKQLKRPCEVTVYSDSQWLVNCANGDWNRNVHPKLWAELDALMSVHKVYFQWIRGHNGHPQQESAHTLAERSAREGASS